MAAADHRSDPGAAPPATETEPPATETEPPATETEPPATETEPPATETEPPATETEPDARYTFANERTFLAWTRTALAFIVAGLGVVQLLPPFPGVPWGRHVLGIPLIVLGAVIAVVGYRDWSGNQRALRRREPVRRSPRPQILVVSIVGMAVVAAIVLFLSAILKHG
jgi:putative membrane protein